MAEMLFSSYETEKYHFTQKPKLQVNLNLSGRMFALCNRRFVRVSANVNLMKI